MRVESESLYGSPHCCRTAGIAKPVERVERRALAHQLSELERSFEELVESAELQPPDDEHDPDGTTAYERAQVTSLARATRAHLAEVDRALAAVDDAGFGACAHCGESIGVARLEALPGVATCVTCAAAGLS